MNVNVMGMSAIRLGSGQAESGPMDRIGPYKGGCSGQAGGRLSTASRPKAGQLGGAVQKADEQVLVRQAQAGNRPAFEELVRRYDRDVLRLAMNLVRGSEDARDLYQEVFLRAYRNLSRFRFECSFYTWIYRIATNVCLDHLRRKNTRREEQAPVNPDGETATDFFDQQMEQRAAANPERNFLGRELGQRIDAALDGLSPRERMVFELKHYEGLRLRAIGDMLGTSEETVKNSLFRATRKMRASLGGMR